MGFSFKRVCLSLLAVAAIALPVSQLECFSYSPYYCEFPQSDRLELIVGFELFVALVWWCGRSVLDAWQNTRNGS